MIENNFFGTGFSESKGGMGHFSINLNFLQLLTNVSLKRDLFYLTKFVENFHFARTLLATEIKNCLFTKAIQQCLLSTFYVLISGYIDVKKIDKCIPLVQFIV